METLDELDGQKLIAMCKGGCPEAWRVIVEKFGNPIYRFALGIVRNREDAEDVGQATLMQAYQKITTFRGEAGLKTWLFQIAYHEAIGQLRKAKRDNNLKQVVMGQQSRCEDPSNEVAHLELVSLMSATLDRLGADERGMLSLKMDQGLSYREIAEIFGVSEATARRRVNVALETLARLLGDQGVA